MSQPRLITAAELAGSLQAQPPRIVAVSDRASWLAGRIPGATQVDYEALNRSDGTASGLMPDVAALEAVLSAAGVEAGREVVVYDAEAGTKAGRLAFVLDAMGHPQWSFLNGGLSAWVAAGGAIESGDASVEPAAFQAQPPGQGVADRDYIQRRLGADDFLPVDTRSAAEYAGIDRRAARGGHIPGAAHFDWVEAMDPNQPPVIADEARLRAALLERGITPDKEVVVYCQTHHRSSHTYVLLRALGYPRVRGYPGAWSDWGNQSDTPIES